MLKDPGIADLKPGSTILMKIVLAPKISILSPYKAENNTVLINKDITPASTSSHTED